MSCLETKDRFKIIKEQMSQDKKFNEKMKLSVVIPCYNESNTIKRIVEKVLEVPLEDMEIIIIDDGSSDGTTQILKREIEPIVEKVIYHEKNIGKGAALRSGFQEVTGDLIIIQDADLEYDPNDYIKMLHAIQHGDAPVVYGSRRLNTIPEKSYNRYYFGGVFLTWLTNLLYGSSLTDEPTCYKMFKTEILKTVPLGCNKFEFCPEVTAKLLKRGIPIVEVPISYYPRKFDNGKKIRWQDGVAAIFTLIKYRFFED